MLYHHSCHGKLDLVLLRHCSPPAGLNRAPTAATITNPLICTVSAPRSPGPFCQLNSANRAVPVAFSMAWYESVLHSPARAGGVPAEWLALWPSSLYRNVPSPGSIANVRNTAAAAALDEAHKTHQLAQAFSLGLAELVGPQNSETGQMTREHE